MKTIQLPINRELLDANFEGYKVSMQNLLFSSKKMEQNISIHTPNNEMVTLQHMRVFSNDNQLFSRKSNEHHESLYRILDTGHIQQVVYGKVTKQWDTTIVGKIDVESNENAFPNNMIFTDKDLVVISTGSSEVSVFLIVENNWVKMLTHQISANTPTCLMEARVINENLHILAYQIEMREKKTVSKIYSITVGLSDLDFAETLTVLDTKVFWQEGHFETCTLDTDGNLIFLSSEKPHLEGAEEAPEYSHTWKQDGRSITVSIELGDVQISEEDVDIEVSKNKICLKIKGIVAFDDHLFAEIDEHDVEICADQKENKLKLVLKATEEKKWSTLTSSPTPKEEKSEPTSTIFSSDEPSEECDEADISLTFFWISESGKVFRRSDVSGCQVLFIRRDGFSPAQICLRHDVDGIIWSFQERHPIHVATLQAFGYVQASKTTRFWSGCSPSNKYACIVEANNRVLIYSQKVEISGSLSNRKTSTRVSHIAQQHLLRVECSDPIRGVLLTDTHLFAATSDQIHVVELLF